jgi:arginyl-tRNA synthetase
MVLEKRFSDYETLGELFSDMEEDIMSLTLWKRILACLQRLMTVLCERLGVTFDELAESFLYDEEAAAEYKIMAKALEESRKRA